MFARHGAKLLLVSKFVVGLDAVAVPLTGAAGVAIPKFVSFDAGGALFWSAAYTALGFAFSNQLDVIALQLARAGALITVVVGIAVSVYATRKIMHWRRFVRQFRLARITPEELNRKLDAGEDIPVVDLQHSSNQVANMLAIRCAVRINPRRLEELKVIELSPSKEIVLYCASAGELISARVALALHERGIEHVRPLAGGLRRSRDCGFPVAKVTAPNPHRAVPGFLKSQSFGCLPKVRADTHLDRIEQPLRGAEFGDHLVF